MSSILRKLTKDDLIDRLDILQEVAVKLIKGGTTNDRMKYIVEKAMDLCVADGGSLYLLNENKDALIFEALINQSFEQDKSFEKFSIPLDHKAIATHCYLSGEVLSIPDVYLLGRDYDFKFNSSFDREVGYRTKSMLAAPLVDSAGNKIGVIQLINHKNYVSEKWEPAKASGMPTFSELDRDMLIRFATLASASLETMDYKSGDLSTNDEGKKFII